MENVQVQGTEITIKGIAAAPGIVVGPAYVYSRQAVRAQMKPITAPEIDPEIERLRSALDRG